MWYRVFKLWLHYSYLVEAAASFCWLTDWNLFKGTSFGVGCKKAEHKGSLACCTISLLHMLKYCFILYQNNSWGIIGSNLTGCRNVKNPVKWFHLCRIWLDCGFEGKTTWTLLHQNNSLFWTVLLRLRKLRLQSFWRRPLGARKYAYFTFNCVPLLRFSICWHG